MFKKVISMIVVACLCMNIIGASSFKVNAIALEGDNGTELFSENYGNAEGNLSAEWVKLNGVDYNSDSMSLYREDGDDETKQLERKFGEDAKGIVTLEYEFANINTNGSTKPVQLELKALDAEGAVGKILIMHHADNKIKVKEGSAYTIIDTVNLNEKSTLKIVVDTVCDKLWVGINGSEPQEYPIFTDMDITQLSSIYWTLTSGKYDTGLSLYSMKAFAKEGETSSPSVTDEEKLQLDINEINVTTEAAIKVNFTVPITGTNGSVFNWESDNTATVAIDNTTGAATVTQGDEDQSAKLTVTGTLNDQTITKYYNVTVAKKEVVTEPLFTESYGNAVTLTADWVKLNGVDYDNDSMSLYREDGDDETKQLERKFSEKANGLVTIEYDFANINTNGSIKPVQLELKALDADGAVAKILIMHHADNKIKVKEGSSYTIIDTVNLNEKSTLKIVVDTVSDKLWVGVNDNEPQEYALLADVDIAQLSSIYWTLTSGKYDTGLKLYSMKAYTTVVEDTTPEVSKLQLDLDAISLAATAGIKADFTVPVVGTNGTVFTWVSDNVGALAVDNTTGAVTATRQENEQQVKLTVTGTLDGKSETKVFDLTVASLSDSADYLFNESYANAEGKLTSDWSSVKGVVFNDDCMTLYREPGDSSTKQLKRTFTEEANGVVTIDLDFANIGTSTTPVQFFLKAKNTANEEVTVLTSQHTPTVVRVRTVSPSGQVVYEDLKATTTGDKYTAKFVVDTVLDKVFLTVGNEAEGYETQEYPVDEDLKHVSLMYWTITSDKIQNGMNFYQMKASTSVTDDLKILSDLSKIDIENKDAIKEDFILATTGKLGSTITWESNNEEVIAVNNVTGEAVVTRKDTDQVVKLNATGSLNGTTKSKEIEVTVRRKLSPEEEIVEKDKEALTITDIATTDLLLYRDGKLGSKITWKSSDISVITNNGEVIIGKENQVVTLTATITYGNISDTKEFIVTVPKENTSSRPAKKERNMTDEEFLGIWHTETQEWIMKPKMNYGYNNNPILKSVEDSVKKGDYTEAKKLLLDYYISKDRHIEEPSSKRENQNYNEDFFNDFYCKITKFGRTEVSPNIGYSTVDITEKVAEKVLADGSSMDMVIINEDKNEEVIIDSREGANPPSLTIVADGKTYKMNAVADSYIRGGKNGNTNYGSEPVLKALDSGMPVDDDSKRVYIRFDLPELPTTANIESAELSFYGFAREHNPEKPNESNSYSEATKLRKSAKIIVGQSEEINFNESDVKWNAPQRIRHYSFKGNTEPYGGMDYIHTNKPGMDKQYVNTYARFWHQEGLIGAYEETGIEKYAERYIREIMVYYTKVGGGDLLVKPDLRGTNTQLNAGFRQQLVSEAYYSIVDSESMTPDDNLQYLKFVYDDAQALILEFYWLKSRMNNWGMEMTVGNQTVIENFPEFATTDKNLDIIADRMSFLLGKLIRTDGAYIEGTNGYPTHILENIYAYKKAMDELNYKVPDSLESQIVRFATFFINCREPNGYIAEYGDDHYDQKPTLFKEIEEIARSKNDEEMIYVATKGAEGKEPLHQSAFYPDGRWATLRDGWDKDSIFSFVNWMPIDTHSHNDVLGLTVTAYGRRLLADTSDKSYNNDPISNWQRVSRFSHNVVAIDDMSGYQMYKSNWSNPNLLSSADSDFTNAHDILTMQLVEKEMPSGDYISDRKVTFLKPLKFFVVSDHLDAVKGDHKYTQTWIFDALALPTIDAETGVLRTNFNTGANVLVVPDSNADMLQTIEDGYHEAEAIEYGRFVKQSGAVETFDTVIYPIKEGDKTEVLTSKIDMGDNKLVSAMTVEVKKSESNVEKGAYYITHEPKPVYREFGEYGTDSTMAYVNKNSDNEVDFALIQNGSVLKLGEETILKSDVVLSDLSLEYTDKVLNVVSTEKVLANLGNLEILAVDKVKAVTFNGVYVSFKKQRDKLVLVEVKKENLAFEAAVEGMGTEIVDGNPNTSWKQSKFHYPKTVTIDLGKKRNVGAVEVLWGLSETQNGVYNYKVQTSLDGTNFVDANGGRGFERSMVSVQAQARYIRLVVKNNTFYDPIEIREVNVYRGNIEEADTGDESGSAPVVVKPKEEKQKDSIAKVILKDLIDEMINENGKIDRSALKSVREALKESGIVKEVKAARKEGSFVAMLDREAMRESANELIKSMESFKSKLTKEAFENFRKSVVVTVPVADVSKKDKVKVALQKETLKELKELGVGLKVDIPGTGITIPKGAIPSALLDNATGGIELKREVLDETVTKKMLDKLPKGFKSAGEIYEFKLNVGDETVSNFDEPLKIEATLPDGFIDNFDPRKVMFYNLGDNGEILDYFPGKVVDGKFVADVNHFSAYSIVEMNKTFDDIQGRWSQDAIEVCASRQITNGVSEETFAPEEVITRGQFVTMLGRALNLKAEGSTSGFGDVDSNAYYADYVAAMRMNNLVSGYEDNTFRADKEITRQEMTKMIMDAYEFVTGEAVEVESSSFTDMNEAASWSQDKIKAAAELGIANGMGNGEFNPKGTATREQMAKMIVELLTISGEM